MEIETANSHPFKVTKVQDEGFYANSHPYKVVFVGGSGAEGRVVDELPEEGESGYIYLVLKEETAEGDIYDEYMWVLQQDGETYGWEHIGATNEVKIKLYDELGDNTDGAATQRVVTSIVGKARILTEDDYEYPSGTPDRVRAYRLEPGVYTAPNARVAISSTSSSFGSSFIVFADQDQTYKNLLVRSQTGALMITRVNATTGQEFSRGILLKTSDVIDNLASTSTNAPLSANQGRVLNEKIGGDLSNLITMDKTSLINAINELASSGGAPAFTNAEFNSIFNTNLTEES